MFGTESPGICFCFYLEMRGPMFRWSGSSVVDRVALFSFGGLWSGRRQAPLGGAYSLHWVGFTHFFLGEIATAAIEKKEGLLDNREVRWVGSWGASFVGLWPA
jgi:hypothetical protein